MEFVMIYMCYLCTKTNESRYTHESKRTFFVWFICGMIQWDKGSYCYVNHCMSCDFLFTGLTRSQDVTQTFEIFMTMISNHRLASHVHFAKKQIKRKKKSYISVVKLF